MKQAMDDTFQQLLTEKALSDFIMPIWCNTYYVHTALEFYDGIAAHESEINKTTHGHFFGLAQQFAINAVIIGLYKIYDVSNPRYEKHTVPALFDILEENLPVSGLIRVEEADLVALGFSPENARKFICASVSEETFAPLRDTFFRSLKEFMPQITEGSALDRLIRFRNKVGAHQEKLNDMDKELVKTLPQLEEIAAINKWADNFCKFVVHAIMQNTSLSSPSTSARMAAKNVIAKVIGKDFDDLANFDEYLKFMQR